MKIDASVLTLQPLKPASSASLDVGDQVAAIGIRSATRATTGIVSGVDRTVEAPNGFTVAHAIRTDAAVDGGEPTVRG